MTSIEGSFAPIRHAQNVDRNGDHQHDETFPVELRLSIDTVCRSEAPNNEYVPFCLSSYKFFYQWRAVLYYPGIDALL